MNAATSFLYGFITGDDARLKRFLERWKAGGVDAARALMLQVVVGSLHGDEALQKLQRRLLTESLATVSWLALGMAVDHYQKERNVA